MKVNYSDAVKYIVTQEVDKEIEKVKSYANAYKENFSMTAILRFPKYYIPHEEIKKKVIALVNEKDVKSALKYAYQLTKKAEKDLRKERNNTRNFIIDTFKDYLYNNQFEYEGTNSKKVFEEIFTAAFVKDELFLTEQNFKKINKAMNKILLMSC